MSELYSLSYVYRMLKKQLFFSLKVILTPKVYIEYREKSYSISELYSLSNVYRMLKKQLFFSLKVILTLKVYIEYREKSYPIS